MESVLPVLKWAGGKRWLLPHLRILLSPHRQRRLVEPFCGGLAVSLGLRPQRALLNDINPHLINFYRWIRRGLNADVPLKSDRRTYDRNRRRFNQLIAERKWRTSEAATLFYYLNRTGFNGLCRFNHQGRFNVPFGKYDRVSYRTEYQEYRSVFRGWTFLSVDFERLPLESTDLIYADPPYDVDFTGYSAGGFSWADQVRTATWVAAHPGPVILSNQATPRILKLYGDLDFKTTLLDAPRRISCNGDRSPAREVLAYRNL